MSRLCRLKTAKHGDDGKWAHDEIVSLRKQRDDLLTALERMVDAFDHRNDSPKNLEKHRCSALVCARAAITSVKGGAA